ncbi:MAG: hypothetical protein ACRELA_13685 [Candidatus Rokuibacteriota bacterium]
MTGLRGAGYAGSKTRLPGYTFWNELSECVVQQLSIEAAQPNLDLAILPEVPAKTIILGVLNDDMAIETPDVVARRIDRALEVLPPERLQVAPDCGMKYLPRPVAFGKLQALVAGTRLIAGA